jgi:hypothetical protein
MGLRGAPRPVVPAKAAAATPTPSPAPTAIPIWTDYLSPLTLGQSYGSSASTPTPTPTPTAAVEALRMADATAATLGPGAAGLQNSSNLITRSDSSAPVAVARVVAFVAGSLAGVFSAILALISMRRRRRQTVL